MSVGVAFDARPNSIAPPGFCGSEHHAPDHSCRFFCVHLRISVPAASGASTQLRLIDLIDDYERAWEHAQQLPEAERVLYFKGAFALLLPGFYDGKRWSEFAMTPDDYDRSLAKRLAGYPDRRSGINVCALSSSRFFNLLDRDLKGCSARRGFFADLPR